MSFLNALCAKPDDSPGNYTDRVRELASCRAFNCSADCPRESRTLFSHADAEARYGASIFWLRQGMLSEAAMDDFLRVWQTRRDGAVRGILEVA
jgi:hypothetical protein